MGKPAAGPSSAVAEFLNGKSLKDFHEARSARVPRPELLGVYAKHCALGHVMAADATACGTCATLWEIDRKARDTACGRDETTPADEETHGNEDR